MTPQGEIALARLRSVFGRPTDLNEPWPTIGELRAEAPEGDLRSAADDRESRYNNGEWLPLAGDPVMDVLDFAGTLEFAHMCTFVDVTASSVRDDMSGILRGMDVRRFGMHHRLFGPAARLQVRLDSPQDRATELDLAAYASCERFLVLVRAVRRDASLEEFLRDLHSPSPESESIAETALASPRAFAEALVRGRVGDRVVGRHIEGGLRVLEHLSVFTGILQRLAPRTAAREQCLRTARWVHDVPAVHTELDRWARSMGAWSLPYAETWDDENRWTRFLHETVVPIEDELRRLWRNDPASTGEQMSPEERLMRAIFGQAGGRPDRTHRARRLRQRADQQKATGSLIDALSTLRALAESEGSTLEPDAGQVLGTRAEIAAILVSLGDLEAARRELESLIPAAERLLGPLDPLLVQIHALRDLVLRGIARNVDVQRSDVERSDVDRSMDDEVGA